MFFLGHLGIGSKLVSPWSKGLPKWPLLLGTALPDLIDKPLYYIPHLITGRRGAELGLISGTRTFGHTALFALGITAYALLKKSRFFAALALGVGSHLLLDGLGDYLMHPAASQGWIMQGGQSALFWPLTGNEYPVIPFKSIEEHLSMAQRPWIFIGEIVGFLILTMDSFIKRNRQVKLFKVE
jgi:hypothetical protein